MVSMPAPPDRLSTPAPPVRKSLPSPPLSVSFPSRPSQHVGAAQAGQHIGHGGAGQSVVEAGAADVLDVGADDVALGVPAHGGEVGQVDGDRGRAAIGDGVAAGPAEQRVRPGAALEHVVAGAAVERGRRRPGRSSVSLPPLPNRRLPWTDSVRTSLNPFGALDVLDVGADAVALGVAADAGPADGHRHPGRAVVDDGVDPGAAVQRVGAGPAFERCRRRWRRSGSLIPPWSTSFPAPPKRTSLPAPPSMLSSPPRPSIVSRAAPAPHGVGPGRPGQGVGEAVRAPRHSRYPNRSHRPAPRPGCRQRRQVDRHAGGAGEVG